MSKLFKGAFVELSNYVENLQDQRILTVGLLTVYLVNKIQFRFILYFELFDLKNFRLGSQKLHLAPLFSLLLIFNYNSQFLIAFRFHTVFHFLKKVSTRFVMSFPNFWRYIKSLLPLNLCQIDEFYTWDIYIQGVGWFCREFYIIFFNNNFGITLLVWKL